ncbi:MAG TPA: hypothetical protein VL326_14025 [Kofleriaceae bacterium]|jgi:hypothetical protein|nr:hypothetical protein [Kofleriaceae bacterium]
MAESESSGSTGVVAIFAILLMIMIAGFIAWRAGVFGGGNGGSDSHHSLDINVNSK